MDCSNSILGYLLISGIRCAKRNVPEQPRGSQRVLHTDLCRNRIDGSRVCRSRSGQVEVCKVLAARPRICGGGSGGNLIYRIKRKSFITTSLPLSPQTVGAPVTPEERHVANMQINGYENPTYKYFEVKE